MIAQKASWYQRHMAVIAAAMHSKPRYALMVNAMENANLRPVLIEDLVKLMDGIP